MAHIRLVDVQQQQIPMLAVDAAGGFALTVAWTATVGGIVVVGVADEGEL